MSQSDLESEQQYVDRLYSRLDYLHDRTESDLAGVRRAGATGTPQARSERDAFATLYEARLIQLRGVEDKLCFGRLDVKDEAARYIGRIGLFDDEQTQLLVDWRAPAAREFYQATAANPGEVLLRRHLETRGREVTGIYDDVLDAQVPAGVSPDAVDEGALVADGVLLAALNASRTGRMTDIVATIQSEQDEIIRAPLDGAVVVQGGPGTGKTAVALHRAAYLLYTHRDRLASRGVLLVGPSSVFLRYISQVLPSLGETGVVTTTPEELYPGVRVTEHEPAAAAVVKGGAEMAAVLQHVVAQRQRVPEQTRVITVDGATIRLRPRSVAASIETARRTGRPHNIARVTFVRSMLDHMTELVARASSRSLDASDRADIIDSLRDSRDVRRELNLAWPPLSATQVLEDFYASPERVHAATPMLSNDQRVHLLRRRGTGWTLADIPLLDELAELLGIDDSAERAMAQREAMARADEVKYAQEVLQSVGGSASQMLSGEDLAGRFADHDVRRSVIDSAAEDRSWAYGHIIIDEAQELSAMMWRLLMRRCPSGSMTVVGDIAQTGSEAGAPSWESMLGPLFGDSWRGYELSVNYRTPKQIMDVASRMLAAAGIDARMPRSVRSSTTLPRSQRLAQLDVEAIVVAARQERDRVGSGRVAVIVPDRLHVAVSEAIIAALHTARSDIDAQVAVLTAVGTKGLEFDAVIVVEPQEILQEAARGANHLYVALSRATQRLLVLHTAELPPGMAEPLGAGPE